jgi:hypothetical protein
MAMVACRKDARKKEAFLMLVWPIECKVGNSTRGRKRSRNLEYYAVWRARQRIADFDVASPIAMHD